MLSFSKYLKIIIFFSNKVMLGITMNFYISIMLTPKSPSIICHHMNIINEYKAWESHQTHDKNYTSWNTGKQYLLWKKYIYIYTWR